VAQLVKLIVREQICRFDQIGFRDFVFGICQRFGKLSIIRQEQQAGRIEIQPADLRDKLIHAGKQIVYGRATLGIAVGRQIAFRLIQQNIAALWTRQWLAIESYLVAFQIDPVVRRLDHLSVHADTTGSDPASRIRA
jgi:hypothetical protein